MAKTGVKYGLSDGLLVGIVQVSNDSDLALNYDPESEGMLEVSADHAVCSAQRKWIVRDGGLVEKPVVTLTADRLTFPADGVETCVISHDADTTITVGLSTGETATIDPGETLTITSDAPIRITITVMTASVYADSLTVEAV